MNAERRKQAGQTIVLVILLAILAASAVYMTKVVNQQTGAKPAPQPAATTAQAAPAATGASAAPTQAPPAAAPGAATTTGAAGAAPAVEQFLLNPNLFRVFKLDPPRNPFVQEERWYADVLKQIPGYPQLREESYFDSEGAYLPDLGEEYADEDKWAEVNLSRTISPPTFSLVGVSEDGSVATQVEFNGPPRPDVSLNWTADSGVPLEKLTDPNWIEEYGLGAPAAEGTAGGVIPAGGLPDSSDLFSPGGLSVPGLGQPGEMLTGAAAAGTQPVCHGVSGEGDRAAALVTFNGVTRLLTVGDSIAPRFQVETITADGVVLKEIESDETAWLPISAVAAPSVNKRAGE